MRRFGKHPFRSSLPVSALTPALETGEERAKKHKKSFWNNEDVHLFLLSFAAFFTAFWVYLV